MTARKRQEHPGQKQARKLGGIMMSREIPAGMSELLHLSAITAVLLYVQGLLSLLMKYPLDGKLLQRQLRVPEIQEQPVLQQGVPVMGKLLLRQLL